MLEHKEINSQFGHFVNSGKRPSEYEAWDSKYQIVHGVLQENCNIQEYKYEQAPQKRIRTYYPEDNCENSCFEPNDCFNQYNQDHQGNQDQGMEDVAVYEQEVHEPIPCPLVTSRSGSRANSYCAFGTHNSASSLAWLSAVHGSNTTAATDDMSD